MKFQLEPDEIEQASAMRDSALHPSDFEYGMDDDVGLPDDIMLGGGGSMGPSDNLGMPDMDMGMGPMGAGGYGMPDMGMGPMGPAGGYGMSPMNGMDGFGVGASAQKEEKDFDEKAAEALGMLFKGGWSLLKASVKAFPTMTANDFMGIFKGNTITGIAFCVIGVIFLLFKQHIGWSVVAGGAVTSVLSFALFAINMKKCAAVQTDAVQTVNDNIYGDTEMDDYDSDTDFEDEPANDDDDMFVFESDEDENSTGVLGEDMGISGEMEDETYMMQGFSEDVVEPLALSFDEDEDVTYGDFAAENKALNDVEITNGMVTRQYLFEKFGNAIQTCTPTFADFEDLSDKSDEFKQWNAVVATALAVLAPAKSAEVYLLSVKKKIFCYVLEIQRAPWMKNKDKIVEEIVNAVSYDRKTNRSNPNIYGSGEFAGKSLFVKIVTGDTAQVTIKDIMLAERDFFLNPKNKMPVALGISVDGTPILDDMRYIDYMLVSGLPRKGKSWFVKAIIGQLMFFNSPDDMNFYFLDPKDHASDFASVQTPHVKKFIADDDAIIETLRELVVTEGGRRSAVLQQYDAQNIWELREKRPDVDMPIIYIIIDEVITLASRMEKETAKEFQNLLLQCISRLAFVGIRMMLIPHLVKHNILDKSITDMITWRACVGGTVEQVSSVTGDKKFKARLSSVGDLALLHNSDVEFVHSCSIATSNSGYKDTFEFIAAFWAKVNPLYVTDVEVIHSSVAFERVTDEMLDRMENNCTVSGNGSVGVQRATPVAVKRKVAKINKGVPHKDNTQDTVYVVDTTPDDVDIW